MPGKPHFFPMYPKDLIADDLVRVMSPAELGAYVRLLCAAWVATPPCTVPADDIELARLAAMTARQWAKAKPRVMKPWKRRLDGRFVQLRMLKEFRRFICVTKRRAKAGKKGGLATAAKSKPSGASNATAKLKHAHMTLTAVSSGSPNQEKRLPARARESAVRDALIDMQAGADGSRVLEAVEPPGGFHFRVNFLDHYPKFSHGRDNVQAAERLYAELDVAQQAACEAAVKAFGDCAARWPPGARRYLQSPGKWLETEREHGFVIRKQDWDLPAKGNGKVLDQKVQEKYVGEDSRY